jgi:hypothetical protein
MLELRSFVNGEYDYGYKFIAVSMSPRSDFLLLLPSRLKGKTNRNKNLLELKIFKCKEKCL